MAYIIHSTAAQSSHYHDSTRRWRCWCRSRWELGGDMDGDGNGDRWEPADVRWPWDLPTPTHATRI